MGVSFAKIKLFEAIEFQDIKTAQFIISKNPMIINESFDKKELSFPLIRAV